ncbi:MAG: chromate transporter [Oscillospiraceae bacterium]|jgi:chromate transporter|nr:chromate transporter [Oscillospiraceae bacterium]
MIWIRLFAEFFITGLFAVGGGAATIPLLRDMSARTGWFTLGELADMVAVAESTPGPIGVNMASFAGYRTAGIPGAVTATLGIVTPSVIVVLIIARLLDKYRENRITQSVFRGLRPASAALIASACFSLITTVLNAGRAGGSLVSYGNITAVCLAAALVAATRRIKAHPILFIAASAVVGIIFKM